MKQESIIIISFLLMICFSFSGCSRQEENLIVPEGYSAEAFRDSNNKVTEESKNPIFRSEIDLKKNLFLCPVCFDSDPYDSNGNVMPLDTKDTELHCSEFASALVSEGAQILLVDSIPDEYVPAKTANKGSFHLRLIESPDGKSYIPLFASYQEMIGIFGDKIHIGIVCFEDAKSMCLEDKMIEGIVVAPGQINKVISKELLGTI